MNTLPLFLTLAEASWQRVHYALIIATSALSLGRPVTCFAGGYAVHMWSHTMEGLEGAVSEDTLRQRHVPTVSELREAFLMLGGRAMVCETGLKLAQLPFDHLVEGVEVGGMVRFLSEADHHPITAL